MSKIIDGAIRDCKFLADEDKKGWLNDPSIVNGLFFYAYIYSNKKRRHGNVSLLTHPIRVAYLTAHDPAIGMNNTRDIFCALMHDIGEDAVQQNLPRQIAERMRESVLLLTVKQCWRKMAETVTTRAMLIENINGITDEYGLKGKARKQAQVVRNAYLSPSMRIVRKNDKRANLDADIELIQDGEIRNPRAVRACFIEAVEKLPIILSLSSPVSLNDKLSHIKRVIFLGRLAVQKTVLPIRPKFGIKNSDNDFSPAA